MADTPQQIYMTKEAYLRDNPVKGTVFAGGRDMAEQSAWDAQQKVQQSDPIYQKVMSNYGGREGTTESFLQNIYNTAKAGTTENVNNAIYGTSATQDQLNQARGYTPDAQTGTTPAKADPLTEAQNKIKEMQARLDTMQGKQAEATSAVDVNKDLAAKGTTPTPTTPTPTPAPTSPTQPKVQGADMTAEAKAMNEKALASTPTPSFKATGNLNLDLNSVVDGETPEMSLIRELTKSGIQQMDTMANGYIAELEKRSAINKAQYDDSVARFTKRFDTYMNIVEEQKDNSLKAAELSKDETTARADERLSVMRDNNSRLAGYLKGKLAAAGMLDSSGGVDIIQKYSAAADRDIAQVERDRDNAQRYYLGQAREIMTNYTNQVFQIGNDYEDKVTAAQKSYNDQANAISDSKFSTESKKVENFITLSKDYAKSITEMKNERFNQIMTVFSKNLEQAKYEHQVAQDAVANEQWEKTYGLNIYKALIDAGGAMDEYGNPTGLTIDQKTGKVKIGNGTITQDFGATTPVKGDNKTVVMQDGTTKVGTPGMDIDGEIGDPIPAQTSGKVVSVTPESKSGGYGNQVAVKDSQGNVHYYNHLSSINVKVGQTVDAGSVIANMGNTGTTIRGAGGDGSHLDYRVKNAQGQWIDPKQFLYKDNAIESGVKKVSSFVDKAIHPLLADFGLSVPTLPDKAFKEYTPTTEEQKAIDIEKSDAEIQAKLDKYNYKVKDYGDNILMGDYTIANVPAKLKDAVTGYITDAKKLSTLSGQQTVKLSDDEVKTTAQMASGDLTFNQFKSLFSGAGRAGGLKLVAKKLAMLQKASEMNPNFSPAQFELGYTLAKNNTFAKTLSNINRVEPNLDKLIEFSRSANMTGITTMNQLLNKVGYMWGNKKITDLNGLAMIVGDELSTAVGGATGSDLKTQLGLAIIDKNLSPENFASRVEMIREVLRNTRASYTQPMGVYGQTYALPTQQTSTNSNTSESLDDPLGLLNKK